MIIQYLYRRSFNIQALDTLDRSRTKTHLGSEQGTLILIKHDPIKTPIHFRAWYSSVSKRKSSTTDPWDPSPYLYGQCFLIQQKVQVFHLSFPTFLLAYDHLLRREYLLFLEYLSPNLLDFISDLPRGT